MEFLTIFFCLFTIAFIPIIIMKLFNSKPDKKIPKGLDDVSRKFSLVLKRGRDIGFRVRKIDEIDPNPPWLDKKKIKLGQKFALENFTALAVIDALSLNLIFAWESALDALIYTNKSSSVITASKRYLSTVLRVLSWYQDDLLDQSSAGFKNLEAVLKVHVSVAEKLNSLGEGEKGLMCLSERIGPSEVQSSICPFVVQDAAHLKNGYSISKTGVIHFNQSHMAITQFGFVGLVVLYPSEFGINDTAGIENFVHLWRYIGHMLGVQEEFNLCSGSIEEVKSKMECVLEHELKPHLSSVDPTWEHMSRMVVAGLNLFLPKMSFEGSIAYILSIIGVDTTMLVSKLTWFQYLNIFLGHIVFGVLLKFKPLRYTINARLHWLLRVANEDFSKVEKRYDQLKNNNIFSFLKRI